MKRNQFAVKIVSILTCMLFLSACSTGKGSSTQGNFLSSPIFDTGEVLPQYDNDNSWSHRLAGDFACATEDTIYFSLGNEYIGYSDLTTGINGPLCGKPECSHNDNECNAHVSQAGGLSVYDGKLYWVDLDEKWNPAIYCMDLDGTNRVNVCSLDNSQYQKITENRCIVFHRGYAIISGNVNTVVNSAVQYGVLTYAVSLSSGEETIITDCEVDSESIVTLEVIPYRNIVYLIFVKSSNEQKKITISTWNLKTHETIELYTGEADFALSDVWAVEDGLLFSSASNGKIYKYILSQNRFTFLFNFNTNDGYNYQPVFAYDYLIGWDIIAGTRLPNIRVTNLDGKEIYFETLNLPEWPTQGYGYALLGADSDNLYIQLWLSREEGKGPSREVWNIIEIAQVPLNEKGSVYKLWSIGRKT